MFDYRRIAEDDSTIADFWTDNLLELITRTDNLNKAYLQVKRNKGKVRKLGIPTVVDRVVQQVIA